MGPRRAPPLYIISAAAAALTGGAAHAGGCPSACPPPPPPPCNCAPTTHQVKVPGVSISAPSISIGIPSISMGGGSGVGSAEANASTSVNITMNGSTNAAQSNASQGGSSGGGGGSWSPDGGVTTEIGDIKIYTPPPPPPPICVAWKAVERQVAIQAVCLDDKAVPHPASQLSPDRDVASAYEGEVFRCIAGARMQYTVAEFTGQPDFGHGQTITCQKGEALYHSANGALQCRPQTPARDCNERSLLRRFGAGIKVMATGGQRVCTAWGPAAAAQTGPMALN